MPRPAELRWRVFNRETTPTVEANRIVIGLGDEALGAETLGERDEERAAETPVAQGRINRDGPDPDHAGSKPFRSCTGNNLRAFLPTEEEPLTGSVVGASLLECVDRPLRELEHGPDGGFILSSVEIDNIHDAAANLPVCPRSIGRGCRRSKPNSSDAGMRIRMPSSVRGFRPTSCSWVSTCASPRTCWRSTGARKATHTIKRSRPKWDRACASSTWAPARASVRCSPHVLEAMSWQWTSAPKRSHAPG